LGRKTVKKIKLGDAFLEKEIPDWSALKEVMAIRHSWNADTMKWTQSFRKVKIAPKPFERGSLRSCYYMLDLMDRNTHENVLGKVEPTHVCKISLDPYEERITYFNDAAMQAVAQKFADLYNQMIPPKNVGFLVVSVYQIREGQWNPHRFFDGLCNVEKYIKGKYVKYTTNWDQQSLVDVTAENGDNRNTPPAFSHFTYLCSGRKLVVVDIQGVNDLYTDPQMHTVDKKGFGKGNMGKAGIEKFLNTHKCNAICQYLKLQEASQNDRRTEDALRGGLTLPGAKYTNESLQIYDASTQVTNVPKEEWAFPALLQDREEKDIKREWVFPPRVDDTVERGITKGSIWRLWNCTLL